MGAHISALLLLVGCQSRGALAPIDGVGARASDAGWTVEQAISAEPTVVINEIMAANDSVVMDEAWQPDDWVELYNTSDAAVDLSGWGLGRSSDGGPEWTAASGTTLEAGARLLIWLDGEPEQGANHAPFSLDAGEDELTLFGAEGDGSPALERWSFEDQQADVSLGRFPDGGQNLDTTVYATPNNPNPWDPGMDKDPSNLLFDPDRVQDFELWLPDESMEALEQDPYTYVEGAVAFQGVWLAPVGVHIKGVWGSLRDLSGKAAFKVKVDEYIDGARIRGMEKLTFNNMVQDPSCVHERLAYRLFRDAGVPAPRTGYATLTLNGELRGLYNHVESPDDTFLARWFDDPDGNFYEGAYGPDVTLSSYTSLTVDQDGAEDVEPYSDLLALATLLAERPTEDRVADLEALVDVDEVLRVFAGEVMTAHWDGYFWYPNNYRVYHDPSTGLLSILPWGTDQTFSYGDGTFSPSGYLGWWCLQIPSLRERYMLALWDMDDRIRALDLAGDAEDAFRLIRDDLEADPYKEVDMPTALSYMDATVDFLGYYPDDVMAEVFPDGVPEVE